MGYGKERPCKKCGETALIMARGLCSPCFSRLKNLGRLEEFPAKQKRIKPPSREHKELLEIHSMMMSVSDVSEDTPASGMTADMVKQHLIFYKKRLGL